MKVSRANIRWLDSGLPYSNRFDDIYHSEDDALGESLHVFINANNLINRWLEQKSECSVFTIAEIGFGTGLNFLQTCRQWQATSQHPRSLHYLAFEKYPISKPDLQKIFAVWPQFKTLSEGLLTSYDDHSSGCHRIILTGDIILDLYFGDAEEQLSKLNNYHRSIVDCWYLDGFSPQLNEDLWSDSIFQQIAKNSAHGASLTTYSVAAKVRNGLKDVGFLTEKQNGFGRKRHMLCASYLPKIKKKQTHEQSSDREAIVPQWHEYPLPKAVTRTALVIGAGLAGCCTAYSLALRGWEVTVVEKGPKPASCASGIAQLSLRCRLFKTQSAISEFYLQCFIYARRQFSYLSQQGKFAWQECGVIQLNGAMNKSHSVTPELQCSLYDEAVAKPMSSDALGAIANATLRDDGVFFPSGGWVDPHSLCEAYLEHPNIHHVFNTEITKIESAGEGWSALNSTDSLEFNANNVIICTAASANQFDCLSQINLEPIRGHSTLLSATDVSNNLATVVSGTRSIFPSYNNEHCISASYENLYTENSQFHEFSNSNIAFAQELFADENYLGDIAASEQVAVRCHSADRVPIVGLIPDWDQMRIDFSDLSRNAKAIINKAGTYYPGLFVNVAHGSNGLTSCPLSGEFLASLMSKENSPLSSAQAQSLNPTRFLMRELKKQRMD